MPLTREGPGSHNALHSCPSASGGRQRSWNGRRGPHSAHSRLEAGSAAHGKRTTMDVVEAKWSWFAVPAGVGLTCRFVAVTFVLLGQMMGRPVSSDSVDFLEEGLPRRGERFMRDVNDKPGIAGNAKLPYQNYREPGGRFSNYPEVDGFVGKSKSVPLTTRIVRTKYGDVSGVIVSLDSRHLEPVEVFRGIPYAMPPIGSLRFMPPVSGALWSGVKYADRFGPVCPQRLPDISNETLALKRMPKGRLDYLKRLLPYLQNQSEDCLYLNIYAPAQAGSRESSGSPRKYPVLLFVHGESYEWNSGNPYDGSVLASYGGVVVVTINYRLGILGFLNSNTDSYLRSPANYGLMDQIAALHWIQENIAVFGGDPTNVTVLGHGTGAACVNLLMASSAVPDGMLFHRAILMSGSALGPWALVQNPVRYAHQVAKHANCSPDLPQPHLLKCLRDRPLHVLLSTPVEAPEFAPVFGPSVDGVVIDSDESPEDSGLNFRYGDSGYNELLSNPTKNYLDITENAPGGGHNPNSVLLQKNVISRMARYDLLLGVVRAESYFAFNAEDVQYGIEGDRRAKILKTFVKENYRYHLSEILATIVNEYTDWERPVQHPINIRDETLEALSDAMYVAPVVHTADLHSALKRNNFLYVFDYQTKFGDYPQRQGCIHGEELPYIFGAPLVGGFSHFARNYTKSEMLLSEAAMIYWSNFARSGNPNEPQDPDPIHGVRQERNRFKNIEWIAYEGVHKKYLNIERQSGVTVPMWVDCCPWEDLLRSIFLFLSSLHHSPENTKPKVKNHFRAHRLSFWLKLVPDLHRPGGEDVPRTHHLLSEDGDHSHVGLVHSQDVSKVRGGIQQRKTEGGTVIEVTGKQGTITGTININHQFDLNGTDNGLFSVRGLQPLENIISDNVAASASASAVPPQQEDGFAAYSTALSVTIAIGCSLLIVNVLIFAGVYYQRDKNRLSRHHHHHHPDGGRVAEAPKSKTIIENGIPNSICGDILLNAEVCKSGEPDVGNFGHMHHHIHHQLPLPEFTELGNNSNLPRAHPPPKHQKLTPCGVPKVGDCQNFGTLPRSNLQTSVQYSVGTLPRAPNSHKTQEAVQALHVLSPGGPLSKKSQVLATKKHEMDELRV